MTDSANEGLTSVLTDYEWWNRAVGRAVRTLWHFVGFYAALVSPVERLSAVLFVGAPPAVESVSLPVASSLLLAAGLAVSLSAMRPETSSARTLAFGFAATLAFRLAQHLFGQPQLAGRVPVAVDVALAATGALALSAVVAFGFDWSDLPAEASAR